MVPNSRYCAPVLVHPLVCGFENLKTELKRNNLKIELKHRAQTVCDLAQAMGHGELCLSLCSAPSAHILIVHHETGALPRSDMPSALGAQNGCIKAFFNSIIILARSHEVL